MFRISLISAVIVSRETDVSIRPTCCVILPAARRPSSLHHASAQGATRRLSAPGRGPLPCVLHEYRAGGFRRLQSCRVSYNSPCTLRMAIYDGLAATRPVRGRPDRLHRLRDGRRGESYRRRQKPAIHSTGTTVDDQERNHHDHSPTVVPSSWQHPDSIITLASDTVIGRLMCDAVLIPIAASRTRIAEPWP